MRANRACSEWSFHTDLCTSNHFAAAAFGRRRWRISGHSDGTAADRVSPTDDVVLHFGASLI